MACLTHGQNSAGIFAYIGCQMYRIYIAGYAVILFNEQSYIASVFLNFGWLAKAYIKLKTGSSRLDHRGLGLLERSTRTGSS